MTRQPSSYVRISREVEEALLRSHPIVGLESTLIAHGFPHPLGLETAAASEEAVRAAGATPATVALLDGEIRVGLSEDELERVATAGARKVGPRDLAAALADEAVGATTVAGTIAVARLCGIHHVATGGIGGVHRGAELTFDISADLAELARTQVCLVCSGAKSLLDVSRTLEVLETLSVPVAGYGTSSLPLFYAAESPYELHARVDTPAQAATLCAIHWDIRRGGAVVIANPPPRDSALDADEVERMIARALADAAQASVRGPEVTPFVLARLHERSGGRTQTVNRDLIVANAGLAAEIAVAAAHSDRSRA